MTMFDEISVSPVQSEINFTKNANNKLSCEISFAHVELDSPDFTVGKKFRIMLKRKFLYRAAIIEKKLVKHDEITELMAFLSSGCCAEAFKKELFMQYGSRPDWKSLNFCVLLMRIETNTTKATAQTV